MQVYLQRLSLHPMSALQKISIAGTKLSPEVNFDADAGFMSIKGRSLMEKTVEFYEPLLDWVSAYFQSPQKETTIELQIEFLEKRLSFVFQSD